MTTNERVRNRMEPGRECRPGGRLAGCRKVLDRIEGAKAAIFSESQGRLGSQKRLLRLALNEAESEAWQTDYPHLLFPALAAEKVHSLAEWSAHQREVRRRNPIVALAV